MEEIGHATSAMTLDTYGHLFPEDLAKRREQARLIDEKIGQNSVRQSANTLAEHDVPPAFQAGYEYPPPAPTPSPTASPSSSSTGPPLPQPCAASTMPASVVCSVRCVRMPPFSISAAGVAAATP